VCIRHRLCWTTRERVRYVPRRIEVADMVMEARMAMDVDCSRDIEIRVVDVDLDGGLMSSPARTAWTLGKGT
jgi:hypothetical protein